MRNNRVILKIIWNLREKEWYGLGKIIASRNYLAIEKSSRVVMSKKNASGQFVSEKGSQSYSSIQTIIHLGYLKRGGNGDSYCIYLTNKLKDEIKSFYA